MKKALLFGMFLSSLFIFTNCSKVESVLNTGIVQCKINGAAWKSTILSTAYISVTSPAATSTLTAIGTDSKKIVILFSKHVTVGTYTSTIDTNSFVATYVDANNKSYISTGGVVQVTEVDSDGKISGNFYFTAAETSGTVSITEGVFTKVVKK
jgi:hypothetical protein